jgi:hypothetical protein
MLMDCRRRTNGRGRGANKIVIPTMIDINEQIEFAKQGLQAPG